MFPANDLDFKLKHLHSSAYFKSMADALDIRTRTHSLNSKITYAAEVSMVSSLEYVQTLNQCPTSGTISTSRAPY